MQPKRRWRDYRTRTGARPVKRFLEELTDADRAAVLAAMKEIQDHGTPCARHLDGDIWEVRADGRDVIYRVLFAEEGRTSRILLALSGFKKKTQKTPPAAIKTAKDRLKDWRDRA
jgi:phage-related protein